MRFVLYSKSHKRILIMIELKINKKKTFENMLQNTEIR